MFRPSLHWIPFVLSAVAFLGCSEDGGNNIEPPIEDTTPPARVVDLTVVASATSSVALNWTAPGDDGTSGTAAQYDIRFSTGLFTEEDWGNATPAPSPPTPQTVGSTETFAVTNLFEDTVYYFAIKSADEESNWSSISNVVQARTETPAGVRRLTNSEARENEPAWSPDGSSIAFSSSPPGSIRDDLWVTPSEVGAGIQLTDTPGEDETVPSWSPDGSQIIYGISANPDFGLLVIPATGGDPDTLTWSTSVEGMPSWSPDGSTIAFLSHRSGNADIWTIPATGGEPVQITDDQAFDISPVWSPDGSLIAFSSNRAGGSFDIWVVPPAGGTATQITSGIADDVQPCWSPDGSRIAFTSDRSGNFDVWVVAATGGTSVQITTHPGEDTAPCWSPDGTEIIFVSKRDGWTDLWITPME
jgi:Tol biopolymer transport system component